MVNDPLSRFESHIQSLVEGGFSRLFAGRLHPRDVAVQLARALEDGTAPATNGTIIGPDTYTVRLNPDDHQAIHEARPDLSQQLSEELVELARTARITLSRFPDVQLIPDRHIAPHRVEVRAIQLHSVIAQVSTGIMNRPDKSTLVAPAAYLDMEDGRRIALDRTIIMNIGRGRDNHIIIDDPRISRHHAQIRLRFGRYMLFDLGSSTGTRVNDEAIQEIVLSDGARIFMGGHLITYQEQNSPPDNARLDTTQAYQPPPLES
jgi:hypothetical protein